MIFKSVYELHQCLNLPSSNPLVVQVQPVSALKTAQSEVGEVSFLLGLTDFNPLYGWQWSIWLPRGIAKNDPLVIFPRFPVLTSSR